MKKICQNCEYWAETKNSKGDCELQPLLEVYNFEADVLENDGYKSTAADGTCEDFEPRYEEVE